MESFGAAALTSWDIRPFSLALLLAAAAVYIRGWLRGRKIVRGEHDGERLTAFLSGLLLLFIATESPLDAFDHFFLAAHMAQHLLLMMLVPPLLLLGHPTLPLLRGLPKHFVRGGLGPFLSWPTLRRLFRFLIAPPVAFVLFAFSTIFWHLPPFYEAALRSSWVHGLQHASFFWTGIFFWWAVVRPMPAKSLWPEWAVIPYLLAADLLNTGLSAAFVFSGRVLYPSYEALHASSMSAQDDQTLAGLIMWVPGSLVYLIPAFVFAMRLLAGPKLRKPAEKMVRVRLRPVVPAPAKTAWLPRLRRPAQVLMLSVAVAVMADGFFGTQIAPLNLAGVLPWIYWRFLSVVALLTIGNLFCMACPFMLVRDLGRKVFPAKLRWPAALRNKWVPAALLVLYLWLYEAFALWNSPWLTAWIIAGYFIAALIVDGVFRGASFCKYVCPIGQFHFITSLLSPREVRVRNPRVCKSCASYDCIRGNEHARGCELYLFQPKKEGNLDCTFCLDCVKACPTGNVAVFPVIPAATILKDPYRSSIGRLSKRTDWAVLALVIVFGAFVNAAAMVHPIMMWNLWRMAAFILAGAALLPLLVFTALRVLSSSELAHRFAFTLVPLGSAMWLAHLLFHAAGPQISVQLLILGCGLLFTLYLAWRIAQKWTTLLPSAVVACGLYAAGVWILFQPMQMRGLM